MADNTPFSLKNRIAAVTGSSSGIGNTIADKLQLVEAPVVDADIKEPVDNPDTNNSHFFLFKTDVTSVEQVQQLSNLVKQNAVPSHLLACNAGRGIYEKLAEGNPDKRAYVINIHLTSTLRILRSFLPDIHSSGEDYAAFISSVSFKNPCAYEGIYAVTKTVIDIINNINITLVRQTYLKKME